MPAQHPPMRIQASENAVEAFSAAYEEYADAIFRHCRMRVFDRDRAQELMQEAFTKTWEYIARGHDIDNVRAFLYQAAHNLIVDEIRKKKKQTISLDALQEKGFDPGSATMIEEVQVSLDEQRVIAVLRKIDQPYRDAITMRYVDGLTPAEIAQLIGESANVVSVRIHRGLKQLRSHLHHDG